VALILFPTDVARVMVPNQDRPVLDRFRMADGFPSLWRVRSFVDLFQADYVGGRPWPILNGKASIVYGAGTSDDLETE